uniref:Peptidase S1 domain-containing protein n=1 Tax=Timema tahoe TaxID=61484 RepID=A0A7R9IT31_9NEOP|nr:unnamed protein product [Timema tahoe]
MNKCYVQVDQPFQFNSKVQPIDIYPQLDVPDGSKVTVIGWGMTDPNIPVLSIQVGLFVP